MAADCNCNLTWLYVVTIAVYIALICYTLWQGRKDRKAYDQWQKKFETAHQKFMARLKEQSANGQTNNDNDTIN